MATILPNMSLIGNRECWADRADSNREVNGTHARTVLGFVQSG
jgi:hypothetical protein